MSTPSPNSIPSTPKLSRNQRKKLFKGDTVVTPSTPKSGKQPLYVFGTESLTFGEWSTPKASTKKLARAIKSQTRQELGIDNSNIDNKEDNNSTDFETDAPYSRKSNNWDYL